ncbi:GGDEF domain-containing protein [Pigmentiphaga aceris]|uniref:diguanylate cyclase n=1 Tax=Pigmentiphaga aceris TaxID=1940612 RepID=A0A5C0B0E2_9BURK|nr:GGDEF domain-containing protein [Pigmentiphaga aceris]QEI07344.1 GGDEF domain-containing protein [Pigmentiphaga aceris]
MSPIPSHQPADGRPGDLTPDDAVALARSRIFAGCPAEAVAIAAHAAFVRHVPHGTLLLQPGENNAYVYVLVEGQLGIFRDPAQNRLLTRLAPGELVGEQAVHDDSGSAFYVFAQWPARVLAIQASVMRGLMTQFPQVALNMVELLLKRLHDVSFGMAADDGAESLEFMTHRDAVSGLHNRRWMTETFTDELTRASRDGVQVCLLLIDIDYFARLNQALGRAAGDTLLKTVADLIHDGLRPTDICARLSDDSFVALMPGVSIQVAGLIAERIRGQIAGRQFAVHGQISTQLTVSISAVVAENGLDASLEAAGALLQQAKELGRNRVELQNV